MMNCEYNLRKPLAVDTKPNSCNGAGGAKLARSPRTQPGIDQKWRET